MIVRESVVFMTAERQYLRQQQLTPLNPRVSAGTPAAEAGLSNRATPASIVDVFSAGLLPSSSGETFATLSDVILDSRLLLMKMILEGYTGREIALTVAQGEVDETVTEENSLSVTSGKASDTETVAREAVEAGGFHLSLREAEQVDLTIHASLTLANGERVTVEIEQQMSRRLHVERDLSADEAAKFIDPLVINLSGSVALRDVYTDFDINADGETESIARFASDSAYLALDRNGDGVINNGSELFGALSGDGFAELAQFDDDGNGFIDSGDAVFSQLQLFRPGESIGLSSMASAGVEAIYLGSMATPFSLTSRDGDELGRVRASGFYIGEQGAGTVQQIDLVV